MAVNLLPPDAKEQAQRSVFRRTVKFVTTLVLVAYLVAVSGIGGWWLYLSTRHTQLENQIATLTSQIAQKATQEVLLRQEADRITQIDAVVKARPNLTQHIDKLMPTEASLVIVGWDFLGGINKNSLVLAAPNSGIIEAYGSRLLTNFAVVNIDTISRIFGSWKGEISVTN